MKKKQSDTSLSKLDQIRLLAEQCNKALGAEGRVFMGEPSEKLERIPIGVLAFDTITGGGLVRKALVELAGAESSGKSLIALQAVAAIQRSGGVAVWVEGEEFNPQWAKKQGVDLSKLVRIQTISGDQALEAMCSVVENGNPDLVVIDSYQSLGTTREMESGVDQESYGGGGAGQMWGRIYRRMRGACNGGANTAFIGISQVRAKIGGFSPNGAPEPQPTQIRALMHWKAVGVYCRKGEPTFDDPKSDKKRLISREFHLKCPKNKTAGSDKASTYVYNFRGPNKGIDRLDEVVRLGKVYGLIETKGSWLQGYDLRAQGDDGFKEKLSKNPSTVKELYTDILAEATKDE